MKLIDALKRIVPASLKRKIADSLIPLLGVQRVEKPSNEFANISYSHEGEDRILFSLFGLLGKTNGFYVDVGAHHPLRFSNTHLSYLKGWRGINIDASKEAMALFQKIRPRDINVLTGVGEKAGTSTFYIFDETALNTFDPAVAERVARISPYKIKHKQPIEIMPLYQILDIYLPKGQSIDLLSVDVEGMDFDVLKSNDWSRYVPLCVLVEYHSGFDRKEGYSFQEVLDGEIAKFMQSKGYSVFAKTLNTIFFIFKRFPIQTDLKVYTYELAAEFRSKPAELARPSDTFYAIRDFFANQLATMDPAEANFFFVPLNLIQSQFRNEDPGKVLKTLKYLSAKKDHILVATGDFSQRSKKNHFGHAYKTTYDWLSNFVLLALESTDDLIPGQDIGIMPYNVLVDNPYFNTNKRLYLYSFLGQIKHDLLPATHVRSQLAHLENKPDVFIGNKLNGNMRKALEDNYGYGTRDDFELLARNSTFTLAPAGYGKWTYRFFHSILWGSIPVLFSDDYIKPFSRSIPYNSFSITIPEKDILNVDTILRGISTHEIERYQENLKANQSKFTRRAFFEMMVRELEALRQ